jgi:hypothetical protein
VWTDILAAAAPAATPTEPGLPYQQIGLVLVALVTGVTGIVVAIIQRGSKPPASATPPPAPPPTTGSFSISEMEWITVRDRSIRVEAALEALRHEYNTHEQLSQSHMSRMNGKIQHIEGRLGGTP